MKDTVRNRWTPNDGFPNSIARYLRDKAQTRRDSLSSSSSGWEPRHIDALEELAEHVELADVADQTVYALYHLMGGDYFKPIGEEQVRILSTIGLGPSTPEPSDSLAELVAAGVEDRTAEHSALNQKLQRQTARAEHLEQYRERTDTAEAELEALRAELANAEAENRDLRKQRDDLSERLPRPDSAEPAGVSSGSAGKPSGKRAKAPANA